MLFGYILSTRTKLGYNDNNFKALRPGLAKMTNFNIWSLIQVISSQSNNNQGYFMLPWVMQKQWETWPMTHQIPEIVQCIGLIVGWAKIEYYMAQPNNKCIHKAKRGQTASRSKKGKTGSTTWQSNAKTHLHNNKTRKNWRK